MSCSSQKNVTNEKVLIRCIDDYVMTYKDSNIETPLLGMVISSKSINGNIKYFIDDAPEKFILGGINDLKKKNNNSFLIGVYKGILCKFYSENQNDYSSVFKKVSPEIFKKANSAQTITDSNGKNYTVDLSLTNWEPNISIIYNLYKNKKEIKYLEGNKTEIKQFN
jgi:hypothetical protein